MIAFCFSRARSAGQSASTRVAFDDLEAARIARRDFTQRGQAAMVALDGDDALGALEEQRAREPARPGANLDHGASFERSRGARDAPREVEIENEILAEALLGGEAVLGGSRRAAAGAHRGWLPAAHRRGARPRSSAMTSERFGRCERPSRRRASGWR